MEEERARFSERREEEVVEMEEEVEVIWDDGRDEWDE